MKLAALILKNYRKFGATPYEIRIDNIVVLIGANQMGKSSVLDAYEAFASTGAALALCDFHNESETLPVEIDGVFNNLAPADVETLGRKWVHADPKYGDCLKVRWAWSAPEAKGKKYSFDPQAGDWVDGGMGGWDSQIASRIPHPLRIRPNDSAAAREEQIVKILTEAIKAALAKDQSTAAEIVTKMQELSVAFATEAKDQIDDTCRQVSERLALVFANYEVELKPEAGKWDAEKMIAAGSHLRVRAAGAQGGSLPLSSQGTGLQRAFLWSALAALADAGKLQQNKKAIAADRARILLIDEPECFLHPPMVRAARETLYSLAKVVNWQVMATTHSPVFIDVSKAHTTIVRIGEAAIGGAQVFQSTEESFSVEERQQLRMIRASHPTVNEFFFADHVTLVEGETEHAVINVLLERHRERNPAAPHLCVVNCLGKANIPMFARILNQFGTPYTALHDSDARRSRRAGALIVNPMWTINIRIQEVVGARAQNLPPSMCCVHLPDFEGWFFGTKSVHHKPHTALLQLQRPDFETDVSCERIRDLVPHIISGTHSGRWASEAELNARVDAWLPQAAAHLNIDPDLW